jgi:hypothetical protein
MLINIGPAAQQVKQEGQTGARSTASSTPPPAAISTTSPPRRARCCSTCARRNNGINWLYIGVLFAWFCWHNEDIYFYSISYIRFAQSGAQHTTRYAGH